MLAGEDVGICLIFIDYRRERYMLIRVFTQGAVGSCCSESFVSKTPKSGVPNTLSWAELSGNYFIFKRKFIAKWNGPSFTGGLFFFHTPTYHNYLWSVKISNNILSPWLCIASIMFNMWFGAEPYTIDPHFNLELTGDLYRMKGFPNHYSPRHTKYWVPSDTIVIGQGCLL